LIQPITREAVEYVCLNMREDDAREVYGLRGHTNPFLLAREAIAAASLGKASVACWRGIPAAVIGVSPNWPGVWEAWAWGTDDFQRVALSLTRYALTVLKPYVLDHGAHRLQCASRIDHRPAHSWLRAMGARDEGVLRGYGRDGASYVQFSWVR